MTLYDPSRHTCDLSFKLHVLKQKKKRDHMYIFTALHMTWRSEIREIVSGERRANNEKQICEFVLFPHSCFVIFHLYILNNIIPWTRSIYYFSFSFPFYINSLEFFIDLNSVDANREHFMFSSWQIAFSLLFVIRKTYSVTCEYAMN